MKPAEFASGRKSAVSHSRADEPDSPRAWLVMTAAFITGFVVFGITYSFRVFLEPIAAEFQVSRAATSALQSWPCGLTFTKATRHLVE